MAHRLHPVTPLTLLSTSLHSMLCNRPPSTYPAWSNKVLSARATILATEPRRGRIDMFAGAGDTSPEAQDAGTRPAFDEKSADWLQSGGRTDMCQAVGDTSDDPRDAEMRHHLRREVTFNSDARSNGWLGAGSSTPTDHEAKAQEKLTTGGDPQFRREITRLAGRLKFPSKGQ